MSEWISIKDRLPEDQQRVLCHGKFAEEGMDGLEEDRDYQIGLVTFCSAGYWEHDRGSFSAQLVKVTHWMPLPNPPKE